MADHVPVGADEEGLRQYGQPRALRVRRVQVRDGQGAEPAAIAAVVELDGKWVLEMGCGAGRLTRFAAGRAGHVHAFDPKPERVAEAAAGLPRELRERVQFAVHDADALDVERERFDLALCGWSL
jgi:ubiquinone/menaquinone biosynthesis C-methylase UbiE